MLAADANRIDLDCGISYARIATWLDDELGLPHERECWVYTLEMQTCTIALEPLEDRPLGAVHLERSHLTVHGGPDALASFEKLFTLRFISAGG